MDYDYRDPAVRAKARAAATLLGEPAATEVRALLDALDAADAEAKQASALRAALIEVYRVLSGEEPADDALAALAEYTVDEARHARRLLDEARAEAGRNADAAGCWRMIADVVHEVDAAHRGAGRMADDDAAPLVLRALRKFPRLVKERDAARAEAEALAGLLGERRVFGGHWHGLSTRCACGLDDLLARIDAALSRRGGGA